MRLKQYLENASTVHRGELKSWYYYRDAVFHLSLSQYQGLLRILGERRDVDVGERKMAV